NNVIYLRWVQTVATEHWYTIATKEQIENLLWVVKKHEIEYKRPAFETDRVIARTWIGEVTNRLFERHTELLRESDRKLLAKATTLWTPIDLHTKKAVRVDPALYTMFSSR
ncbi:MAG TPA: acyl-CoA thioesterase, partial [Methylophaga sp.]|nr:acyl-CoA thioesterase [Methylophaga sp.]